MNFQATITDVNGAHRVTLDPESLGYDQTLCGRASAQIVVRAFAPVVLSGSRTPAPIVNSGLRPWDRVKIEYGAPGSWRAVWHGFIKEICWGHTRVTIDAVGFDEYAQRKVMTYLNNGITVPSAAQWIAESWANVEQRRPTNISAICNVSDPVSRFTLPGMTVSDVLRDFVVRGYEWRFDGDSFFVEHQVGDAGALHNFSYSFTDGCDSRVFPPDEVKVDDRAAVTYAVGLAPDQLRNVQFGAIDADQDDIGARLSFSAYSAGQLQSYVSRGITTLQKIETPYSIDLNPRFWSPDAVSLGDSAVVGISTNYAAWDRNESTRVVRIKTQIEAATVRTQVTLGRSPFAVLGQSDRLRALEYIASGL